MSESERPETPTDTPEATGTVDPDSDAGQSLPPRPEPTATPPEPPPGGPDAHEGVGGDGVRSTEPRDPDPHQNPATRGELPDDTTESEDTDTEATKGNPEVAPEDEAPA